MLPFLPAAGLPLANVTKMDCRKDAELYFCRICVQQTHRGRSLEKGAAAGGARAAWRTDGDKIAGGNVTCARLQRKGLKAVEAESGWEIPAALRFSRKGTL